MKPPEWRRTKQKKSVKACFGHLQRWSWTRSSLSQVSCSQLCWSFARFAEINYICLAVVLLLPRRNGRRWTWWRFHLSASVSAPYEGALSAGALPPLQHHFNLQEKIWAMLFTQGFPRRKGRCFFPFSIGFIYFLSALPLRLLGRSASSIHSSLPRSHTLSGNTRTLTPCYRCTQVNLTAAATRIKGQGCRVAGGRYFGGMWEKITGETVQHVNRFMMAFPPFSRISRSEKPGAAPRRAFKRPWQSSSEVGSSRVEYILTMSHRYAPELELKLP